MLSPPTEPMLAHSTEHLPRRAGAFSYEPKWDGFRCLAFARPGRPYLQARVGVEGIVIKPRTGVYRPGVRSSWTKLRSKETAEAVVGAVTGPIMAPTSLLLGRYTPDGRLSLVARSTPLTPALRRETGVLLATAGPDHPWSGARFSAGWGTREVLDHRCVDPRLVAEFEGDTAVDRGRWRHPVRVRRIRADMTPTDVPLLDQAE